MQRLSRFSALASLVNTPSHRLHVQLLLSTEVAAVATSCCTGAVALASAACTYTGVQFIHEQGLAHRDLKLENTLIKLEETRPGKRPTPVLKIADFGFCKHEDLHSAPDSRVGTPAYISPVRTPSPSHPLLPRRTHVCCWAGGCTCCCPCGRLHAHPPAADLAHAPCPFSMTK